MAFKNKQNGREMSEDMLRQAKELEELFANDIPLMLIEELESLAKESHTSESYKGSKWQDRKDPDQGRQLLVNSGDLRRSWEAGQDGDTIYIGSDLEYAAVHNEGLRAGRGAGFQMPQRQMIPAPGEPLPEAIQKKLENEIDEAIKKTLS